MARESQGLQVLLIVFVMLAVVLGVTTYLYIKRADEATKAAAAANAAKQQAEKATEDMQKERDDLKRLIGFPERSTEEIQKQFAEDMQTYGNVKKADADKARRQAAVRPQHPLLQPLAGGHVQDHPGPHRRTDQLEGPVWPIWKRNSRPARRPRTTPSPRSPRATAN